MYAEHANLALHHLVHHLERQALKAWRDQHFYSWSVVDALASAATKVETVLERKPGGNVSVTVSIHSRNPEHNHVAWFPLQKHPFGGYCVRESVLPSRKR